MLATAPWVVLLGILLGALSYLLGRLLAYILRLEPSKAGILAFAASCTNTGFLGIPLISTILGSSATVMAVLYDFSTTINIFTFGIAGLNRSGRPLKLKELGRNLSNPMFFSLLLGVAWSTTHWQVPRLFSQLLQLVGDSTVPLAMLALGHMLYSSVRWRSLLSREVLLLTALRLLLAPLLMLLIVHPFPFTPETKAVIVIQAGMPTAMLTSLIAQQYGADHQLGASATMATTLISLFTLPLLTWGAQALLGL